jgi:hypothetical protein
MTRGSYSGRMGFAIAATPLGTSMERYQTVASLPEMVDLVARRLDERAAS